MEDIFYYTKVEVTLKDIAQIAQELGYTCESVSQSNMQWLNVHYDEQHFWLWDEFRVEQGDLDVFELHERDRLIKLQVSSSFSISHHVDSWPKLSTFLKVLLVRYGGWIECDSGDDQETYAFESIDDFQHPCFPAN